MQWLEQRDQIRKRRCGDHQYADGFIWSYGQLLR